MVTIAARALIVAFIHGLVHMHQSEIVEIRKPPLYQFLATAFAMVFPTVFASSTFARSTGGERSTSAVPGFKPDSGATASTMPRPSAPATRAATANPNVKKPLFEEAARMWREGVRAPVPARLGSVRMNWRCIEDLLEKT
jgi:hypothetical protein